MSSGSNLSSSMLALRGESGNCVNPGQPTSNGERGVASGLLHAYLSTQIEAKEDECLVRSWKAPILQNCGLAHTREDHIMI